MSAHETLAEELDLVVGQLEETLAALRAARLLAVPTPANLVPGPLQPAPSAIPGRQLMSEAGQRYLSELEGVELGPYRDQAGIWTIGVGHVIRDGEDHLRAGITMEQALRLLAGDVAWAEDCVQALRLPRPLNQHQFDALCCFAFNIGAGAFTGSTMARKLKSGDYDCVPSELLRWVYVTDWQTGRKIVSSGLRNRRQQTGELWSRGDYTVTWT